MYHFPINDEFNSKSREDYLLEIKRLAVEGSVEHMMLDVYRGFVTTYTHQFRNFLHTVLEYNEDPVLWHCTAGKDRTGFASALLLKLFTVPQEIIENDYAISENHLQYQGIKKFFLRLMYGKKVAETVQTMMGINQKWLAEPFDLIEKDHGGFDPFFCSVMKLSTEDIETLQSSYLE